MTDAPIAERNWARIDMRLATPTRPAPAPAPSRPASPSPFATAGTPKIDHERPNPPSPARWTLLPPSAKEVLILAVLWIAYSAGRLLASDDIEQARAAATWLLDMESALHIDVEATTNSWVSRNSVVAIPLSLWYAALHYIVTPVALLWLYRRRPARYRYARSALLIATGIGLLAYVMLPMAPPRLMPDASFTDTLALYSDYGWWSDHASAPAGLGQMTNELAAMPSLHVGWAFWVWWAIRPVASKGVTLAALVYAYGTAVVVVATGNHWVLDGVAGVAVVWLGTRAARWHR